MGKFLYGALSQVFTNKVSRANTKLNSYSVILAGLAIACSPWAQSYPVLLIIGAAFGISSGLYSLRKCDYAINRKVQVISRQ